MDVYSGFLGALLGEGMGGHVRGVLNLEKAELCRALVERLCRTIMRGCKPESLNPRPNRQTPRQLESYEPVRC